MILTRVIITIFVLFALSRAYLRFKEGKISTLALGGWVLLWILAEIIVWEPEFSTEIARILGIGRGADLLIYASIAILFYLIFRTYVKIEDTERQITKLVRKMAIKDSRRKKRSSRKK